MEPRARTVLLVEDEAVIRDLVSTMLTELGATVLTAGDGVEAVKLAREQQPALILLDIVLPRLDGISACRILKSEPSTRGIRITMLTARIRAADREAAQKAGADGYLEKPFKRDELKQLLDSLP